MRTQKRVAEAALKTLERHHGRDFPQVRSVIESAPQDSAIEITASGDEDEHVGASLLSDAVFSGTDVEAAGEVLYRYLEQNGREYLYRDLEVKEKPHRAIASLKTLQQNADHGEYYAKNIREDLAAAWSRGEHQGSRGPAKVIDEKDYTNNFDLQGLPRGVSIEGAIEDFKLCLDDIQGLDAGLADDIDAGTAEMVYDACEDALNEYCGFVQAITNGLKVAGVKRYLDPTYKGLFEEQIPAFESVAEKLLARCGPLLDTKTPHEKPRSRNDMRPNLSYMNKPQTPEQLQAWTDRTKQCLKAPCSLLGLSRMRQIDSKRICV